MSQFHDVAAQATKDLCRQHGFTELFRDSNEFGETICFGSDQVRLVFEYEPRPFGEVFALISAGSLTDRHEHIGRMDVLDVVAAKTGESLEVPEYYSLFPFNVIEKLNWLTGVLETYASEVLRGDFAIWPDVEKLQRARLSEGFIVPTNAPEDGGSDGR